jgi:molybdopterin synthase catalytic subunit/molybdopterin converting factor small subunit
MIKVLVFGALRERLGRAEIEVRSDEPMSIAACLDAAEQDCPGLQRAAAELHASIAVNDDLILDPTSPAVKRIASRDEIALLPPFSGGSAGRPGEPIDPAHLSTLDPSAPREIVSGYPNTGLGIRIQPGPLSIGEEIRRAKEFSTHIGAIVTFTGTARDLSHGETILGIEVELYSEMALKKLETIRMEAIRSYDLLAASIVVRVGRVDIGEDLILILAGAQHRDSAFRAARWCIEEIKRSVPIWKRELTEEGWRWVNSSG